MGTAIPPHPPSSPVQPRTAAVLQAARGFDRAGNLVRRNPGAEAGTGAGRAGRSPSGRHRGQIHSPRLTTPPLPSSSQTPVPVQLWGSPLSPPQNSGDLIALAETQVSISGCFFCSQDRRNKPSNPQNLSHLYGAAPAPSPQL